MLVVQKTASRYQLASSDLVITPQVGQIRWDEMGRTEELMEAGYVAAIKSMPQVFELIESSSVKSVVL